jgi:ankyrin repeat protein
MEDSLPCTDIKKEFWAELKNHTSPKELQALLDANADINYHYKDNRGKTALHVAVEKSSFSLLKFLLCNKADVNSQKADGATPLIEAAYKGNVEIVKLLLARCADTELRKWTDDNKTALLYVQGYIDYCEKRGFSVQTGFFYQNIQLFLSFFREEQKSCFYYANIAKLIKDTNHTLSRENFSDALSHHDINYIKDALNNNFNANYCLSESTSLHDAAYHGNITILALLLAHGVDVNRQAANGNTPLMIAAYNHHFDFLKYLLWYGADAGLVKNKNETALSMAILRYEEMNDSEFVPIIHCLKNVTDCLTNWLKEAYINPYIKKLPDLPTYFEEYTFESTKKPISGYVEYVYALTARNETRFIIGTIKLHSRRSACYLEEWTQSQFLTVEGIFEQPLKNYAHAIVEFLAASFSKRMLLGGLSAGVIGATRGFVHVLVSRYAERKSIFPALLRISFRIAIQSISPGISSYLKERPAIHDPQNESTTFDPGFLLVVFFLSQVIIEEASERYLSEEKSRYILLGLCAFCVIMFPIRWDEVLVNLVMGMLEGALGQCLGRRFLPYDERLSIISNYCGLDNISLNDYFKQHATSSSSIVIKSKNGIEVSKANCDSVPLHELHHINLRKSDLSKAIFTNASFKGKDVSEVKMHRTRIDGADFSEVQGLTPLQLCEAKFSLELNQRTLKATDKKNQAIIEQAYKLKPEKELSYFFAKCNKRNIFFTNLDTVLKDNLKLNRQLKALLAVLPEDISNFFQPKPR